ncbi:hypothetical protein ElyMa_006946000 [Elysia marginata]|uniref:EGF-like domain-containing protein n=1 Tax=Elysia marginata TaxID=1093978 RepID=A0AAV4JKM4_9GAST|nr:hypothetical protein ElyMa_006946000 [Elysia marginata]
MPEGKRCGFKSQHWLKSLERPDCESSQLLVETRQGELCIDYEDLQEEHNPCPQGQQLTKLDDRLECAYSDRLPARPEDTTTLADRQCLGTEEMLVQTPAGFVCRRVEEAALDLPSCPGDGEVFVKTDLGFECIGEDYVNLVCSDGFLLVRDTGGFKCREKTKEGPVSPTGLVTSSSDVCRQGEVLVIDGGVTFCKRLDQSSHLCGAGFKPKPTTADGSFVCAPEVKKSLECPEGPVCRLIDYVDIVCEEDQPCHTERQRKSCDNSGKGRNSPCLALLRKVWAGCQPQCANGGSCHGDVCVCPPGLTGRACEEGKRC